MSLISCEGPWTLLIIICMLSGAKLELILRARIEAYVFLLSPKYSEGKAIVRLRSEEVRL